MKVKNYTIVESLFGRLLLAEAGGRLTDLRFMRDEGREFPGPEWNRNELPFKEPIRQLMAYFNGELKQFDVPLTMEGTPFQIAAWRELMKIPYGETITYGEQARRIGRPKACRAVGAANGRNPIAVIVPCHRVVGSNGKLVGFGGGIELQRRLLALEKVPGW